MLSYLLSYPKNIFRSLDLRSQISKRIMWIISKSHREIFFFFDIFAIHSSSRREKRCQMSVRLFSLFRGSIYQQCRASNCHQGADLFLVTTALIFTFLFPTRTMGAVGQKCLISGVHFSGMFSRVSGASMLKHITITSVSG